MSVALTNTVFIVGMTLLGLLIIYREHVRSAREVLDDLSDSEDAEREKRSRSHKKNIASLKLRLIPLVFALMFSLIKIVISPAGIGGLLVAATMGLAAGYLFLKKRERIKQEQYIRELEFYLPVVMERLVMAVQAGLDVISAVKRIVELESSEADCGDQESPSGNDPVTELLSEVYQLTNAGIGFDSALNEVAGRIESSVLRHAFIHLGVAYKEGGELVTPLRELSDSTQLYYQETVEEEIAKLPVKATLPLLFTFCGLIIVFITSPLLQVLN
ncbi:MAG: hypothetical protein D6719_10310, partial [Candidatus Dadabacteria bacterium]